VDVTEVHWAHFVVIFVLKKGGWKRKMAIKFYYVFFHQSELRYGTSEFVTICNKVLAVSPSSPPHLGSCLALKRGVCCDKSQ